MAEKNSGGTRNIQVIERAYKILECFGNQEELGITEISKMIGLHKNTTNGIVSTLRSLHVLEQNPKTGKLCLGMGLFKISMHIRIILKEIFTPYMKELSKSTKETVTLHVWNGETTTIVEIIESSYPTRFCTEVGFDIPCHCSAIGKSILASLPEVQKDEILDSVMAKGLTKYSRSDRALLEEDLNQARTMGYGLSREEAEVGVIGIGIPIIDGKGVIRGGIGIGGPCARMTDAVIAQLGKDLLALKERINRELF